MVVIGERSNIDQLKNLTTSFITGAEDIDVRLSVLTNQPANNSDGRYFGGDKHYYPTANFDENFVKDPDWPLPNVTL